MAEPITAAGHFAPLPKGAYDWDALRQWLKTQSISMNQLTAGTIILSSPGVLRSANYAADTSGWNLSYDGSAEFNNVTIRGDLAASTIVGDLVMDSGAIFTETAAPWAKLSTDGLQFYNGVPTLVNSIAYNATYGSASMTGTWFMGGQLWWNGQQDALTALNEVQVRSSVGPISGTDVGPMWTVERVVSTGPLVTALYYYKMFYDDVFHGLRIGEGTSKYMELGFTELNFYISGSKEWSINSSGTLVGSNNEIDGVTKIGVGDGSAAAPSVYFLSDGGDDTGFYRVSANRIGVTAGGAQRFEVAGSSDAVSLMVNGSMKAVTEGATDSGGSGYKVLRVPN